ncbi:MAG: hypothetical protein QN716_01625 [Nitrososphaeraceae archaeon]|nr:hypothetical protein [Nitrososphaeraceae archaeon]
MEIIKESPMIRKKSGPGRTPKYMFSELSAGDCLKIPAANISDYHRVIAALYKFKSNNNLSWDTTTRFDGNTVSVYRLK